ncbi:unnamed protein product [Rhizophagus irregularis]|nr:unnamed protein product [Rhizophagus irregularis]
MCIVYFYQKLWEYTYLFSGTIVFLQIINNRHTLYALSMLPDGHSSLGLKETKVRDVLRIPEIYFVIFISQFLAK